MKTNFIFNLKQQLMTRLWGREGAATECQCNKEEGRFTIDRLSMRYRQNISRIAALFLLLVTMSVGQVWGVSQTYSITTPSQNVYTDATSGITVIGTATTGKIDNSSSQKIFSAKKDQPLHITSIIANIKGIRFDYDDSSSGSGSENIMNIQTSNGASLAAPTSGYTGNISVNGGASTSLPATLAGLAVGKVQSTHCAISVDFTSAVSTIVVNTTSNNAAQIRNLVIVYDDAISARDLYATITPTGANTYSVSGKGSMTTASVNNTKISFGDSDFYQLNSKNTYTPTESLVAGDIVVFTVGNTSSKSIGINVESAGALSVEKGIARQSYQIVYVVPAAKSSISFVRNSSDTYLKDIRVYHKTSAVCTAPGKPTISGGYHYFPGETIALTATASETSGSTTYAWKKNGSAVAGQTTANLNIASCTAANAGKYTVVASNGGGCVSDISNEYSVKILQSYLKDNSGTDLYNAPLTKVDASHARISFELSGNTTYRFNITDGCNNWYGNDGTMNKDNCSNWAFTSSNDCHITTTKAGVYVVTVDYLDLARPVVSVEYPSSNQAAGKTIYFDNSERNWNESKIYYRIGKGDYNSKQQMTKVLGTANLFKIVTNGFNGFEAWHIANNGCWSDGNSIYKTNTGDSWAATEATKFIGNAVTSTITVIPTSEHNKGTDGNNNNCEFYSYQTVDGMKSHTATITAPSNGTITVAYKDVDNVDKNFTSGNRDLAHTCILTITATPATGYSLSGLTVNSGAFTSGSTHILSADATIAATFAANQYTVTLNTNGGTINADNVANYTYGVGATLPTNVTKDGYTFDGWFANSGLTGDAVTTIANDATGNKEYWAKWTEDAGDDCDDIVWNAPTSSTAVDYYHSAFSDGASYFNGKSSAGSNVTPEQQTAKWCIKTANSGGIWIQPNVAIEKVLIDYLCTSTNSGNITFGNNNDNASGTSTSANVEFAVKATANKGIWHTAELTIDIAAGKYLYVKFPTNVYINKIVLKPDCGTPGTYTVTYNMKGHGDAIAQVKGVTALPNPLPTPVATGYNFGGWYTNEGLTSAATAGAAISANTTLYAKWTAKQSAVTFDFAGGRNGQTSTTATYGQAMPTGGFVAPVKDGNTFGGYYDQQNGAGKKYYNADGTSAATWDKENANVTLYAKWNAVTYTVTVTDDGAGQHDCSKNLSAAAGETVVIENTCEVTGYHLAGYTSSPEVSGTLVGTTYTFTMPASDVTLTAQWEEDAVGCTPIITWTLPVNTSLDPSATGSTTDETNITSVSGLNNAGSLAYTSGAKADLTGKIEVPSSKADAKYLYFTFNVKSGKQFVTDEIVVKMQPVNSTKSATMELVISDNHGRSLSKTFADKASGSIHTLTWTLTEAEKTTLGALQGTGTLKLYCYGNAGTYRLGTPITICGTVEEAEEPMTYTITYDCDGAESGCPEEEADAVALPNPLPSAPVKTGKNFGGWYTDSEKTVAAVAGAAISANTTLYAKWVEPQQDEDCYTSLLNDAPTGASVSASNSVEYKNRGSEAWIDSEYTRYVRATSSSGSVTYQFSPAIELTSDEVDAGTITIHYAHDASDKRSFTMKVNGSNAGSYSIANKLTMYAAEYTIPKGTTSINTIQLTGGGSSSGYCWFDVEICTHNGSGATKYTITYDANGGTGTMTAARQYVEGAEVTIKANEFTAPAGQEFDHWTAEDAGGNAIAITDGEFIMPASNVTIHANWRNITVTGVSLNKTATELTLGGATETLTATVTPSGAANKSVTWSSSNESIVTVADGVITAVAVGVATVTVTTVDGSKTATCEVTVKAAAIGGAEVCGIFENSGATVDGKVVHTLSSGLEVRPCDSGKKPTSSSNVTQGTGVKSCTGSATSDYYFTKKYFVLCHATEDIVGLKIKTYNSSVRNIVSVMVGDEFVSSSSFENITFTAPTNSAKGCQELTVSFDAIDAGKYIYVELSGDASTYEICYTPAGNKATKPVLPTLSNLTKNIGQNASWNATVTNATAIAAEGETVTYVWKDEDGTTLSTTAELTLNDVTMASAGKYTVTATVSGDGKTSSTASKTVTLTVNCSDVKPVITKTSAADAIPVVLVAKKSSDNSDYASGDFRWERDGEVIADANTNTIAVTQSGTYTVTYINTCETTSDGFDVTITIPQPEATRLAPFQYVHINKVYDAKHQFVHLFHYVSTATGATKYVVTATIGGETIELPAGAVVEDSEHAGDLLLDLNVMAQEDYNVGDEITLTLKPYDKTNVASTTVSATIQVKIIDDTPTLAFIVSGTNEAGGTKDKNKHAKGGDFLTGVNVADLCLQTAMYKKAQGENPEVPGFDPSQELPLYTALKDNFIVTPVNGYAKFNKWNYEPFDLVFLTDFPKTDFDATALNNLAQLVDYRPIFSTKSYVSTLDKWQALGFKEKPNDPKAPQLWMNITCESHTMFQQGGIDFETIPREEANNEPVFTMLSGAGYDKSKALQGFDVSDADDFVHVAYTHYNATASMEERGGHTYVNPTNVGSDDKKIIVSVERQREMDARLIMLVLNADATSKLTEQGMKVIVSALNYLLITNENDIVDCSLTFDNNKGSGNGKWNTASNWTDNRVPNADEKVRIIAPCVVDNKEAAAAEVKICTGSGHNGSLTITDGGALSVAGKVVRVENGHYFQTLPTSVGDIHIQSSVSGNGAFIHGDKAGQTKASVQMYSKAHYEEGVDGKKTKYWQYVGMPVAEADFNVDFYGAYTYVFDETKAAAWTRVRTGYGVPFVAYGVSQQAAKTYHLSGTLAGTADRMIALTKTAAGLDGMNLIGNSWTAPINIAAFEATDFENAEATVYIYNTGRDGESGNIGDASSTTAGQWISVAVEAAKGGEYVGLKVIPAMQAFQVNATADGASVSLDYDRLVRSTAAANINEPLRAPGRRMAQNHVDADEVSMMRVRVADEKTHTDLYLMEHPMFSEAFDNGWDAGFVEGDGRSATLSAVSELGDMAFLAKESIDGTVLNFAPGRESLYTFSFGYHGDVTYYLNDLQLQTSTRITPDATYSFVAAEEDLAHRFIISATPIANTPTDIGYQTDRVDKVQKVMMDGVLYIIKNGRIYDVLGETVK